MPGKSVSIPLASPIGLQVMLVIDRTGFVQQQVPQFMYEGKGLAETPKTAF